MSLFGTSWDDPKTAAIMGLAGGLLQGNAGAGLQQGLLGYQRQSAINNQNDRQQKLDMRADEDYAKQQRLEQEHEAIRARLREQFSKMDPRFAGMNGPTPAAAGAMGKVDPEQLVAYELAQADPIKYGSAFASSLKPKPADMKVVGDTLLAIQNGQAKEVWKKPEQIDPNKPFMMQNGQIVPNPAYQQFELERASRSAARTNVTVDAAPKAFWQDFGKNASDQLFKEREAAQAAAGTLQSVAEIRRAAQAGAYQGAGAELKLGAAKALQGLGMPYDAKTVANSELFNAQANTFVLNSIKGLGANPSNADREFIEKTVPRLSTDPAALPQLLDFMERKASSQVNNYNTKIRGVQSQPGGQSIPLSLEVPVPDTTKTKAPNAAVPLPSNPTAANLQRGTVYDTPRGRAVWDGMQFKKVD